MSNHLNGEYEYYDNAKAIIDALTPRLLDIEYSRQFYKECDASPYSRADYHEELRRLLPQFRRMNAIRREMRRERAAIEADWASQQKAEIAAEMARPQWMVV